MKNIIYWAISSLLCIQGCVLPKATNDSKMYPEALQAAYKIAHKTDNIRSFLVSKEDTLIAEQYFDRYGRDSLDHVRSVTKSVMAILIGIAIDQGIISSVNDSIGKYLGKKANGKTHITIKHLLTMTSAWHI